MLGVFSLLLLFIIMARNSIPRRLPRRLPAVKETRKNLLHRRRRQTAAERVRRKSRRLQKLKADGKENNKRNQKLKPGASRFEKTKDECGCAIIEEEEEDLKTVCDVNTANTKIEEDVRAETSLNLVHLEENYVAKPESCAEDVKLTQSTIMRTDVDTGCQTGVPAVSPATRGVCHDHTYFLLPSSDPSVTPTASTFTRQQSKEDSLQNLFDTCWLDRNFLQKTEPTHHLLLDDLVNNCDVPEDQMFKDIALDEDDLSGAVPSSSSSYPTITPQVRCCLFYSWGTPPPRGIFTWAGSTETRLSTYDVSRPVCVEGPITMGMLLPESSESCCVTFSGLCSLSSSMPLNSSSAFASDDDERLSHHGNVACGDYHPSHLSDRSVGPCYEGLKEDAKVSLTKAWLEKVASGSWQCSANSEEKSVQVVSDITALMQMSKDSVMETQGDSAGSSPTSGSSDWPSDRLCPSSASPVLYSNHVVNNFPTPPRSPVQPETASPVASPNRKRRQEEMTCTWSAKRSKLEHKELTLTLPVPSTETEACDAAGNQDEISSPLSLSPVLDLPDFSLPTPHSPLSNSEAEVSDSDCASCQGSKSDDSDYESATMSTVSPDSSFSRVDLENHVALDCEDVRNQPLNAEEGRTEKAIKDVLRSLSEVPSLSPLNNAYSRCV